MAFKQVLEYFVAHLEYVAGGEQAGSRGYEKYIEPLVESGNFRVSGQGYRDREIQEQLPEFSREGSKICINVQTGYHLRNASTNLNWTDAMTHIVAVWHENSVTALKIQFPKYYETAEKTLWCQENETEASLTTLGLFNNNDDENEKLKRFFKAFYENYKEEKKVKIP